MKSRSVKSSNPKWKTILLIFGTILLFFIVYYFFRHNYFRDPKALQRVIAKAGVYGPLVFIVFQALQVLFPYSSRRGVRLFSDALFRNVERFFLFLYWSFDWFKHRLFACPKVWETTSKTFRRSEDI